MCILLIIITMKYVPEIDNEYQIEGEITLHLHVRTLAEPTYEPLE